MNLRAWQEAMQAYILHAEPQVLAQLQPGHQPHLAIYAEAYRSRLLESLADLYPGLHALAGDGLLQRYIERYPSTVNNLRWYGQHMAALIRAEAPVEQALWLAMAELEWALAMVFEAPDAALASRASLAAMPAAAWPGLVLQPQPAWRRLYLPAGVVALRSQLLKQLPPVECSVAGELECWLIWRRDYEVMQRVAQPEEAGLIEAMLAGENLAMLCERLAQTWPADQVAARMLGWLEQWLQELWLGELEWPASANAVAQ